MLISTSLRIASMPAATWANARRVLAATMQNSRCGAGFAVCLAASTRLGINPARHLGGEHLINGNSPGSHRSQLMTPGPHQFTRPAPTAFEPVALQQSPATWSWFRPPLQHLLGGNHECPSCLATLAGVVGSVALPPSPGTPAFVIPHARNPSAACSAA